MKFDYSNTLLGYALVLALAGSLPEQATASGGKKAAAQPVDFRRDDQQAQSIAIKLLQRKLEHFEDMRSELDTMRTAWVTVSEGKPAILLVMFGCSPTGNCGLYGYERSNNGWRLVLDSLAQTCSILPSSHDGRQDISASMHDSATVSYIKMYWWQKSRYVRVSVRAKTFE